MKLSLLLEKLVFNIMNNRTNKKINGMVNAMKNSNGKFFSLTTTTTDGPINAQFRQETPHYVVVNDRNGGRTRRFSKSSLVGLKMGQTEI